MTRSCTLLMMFLLCSVTLNAEGDSTAVIKDAVSKFDAFNAKMERLFKIIPVPIYSHSTEAGDVFGLSKFNILELKKSDTISKPSKISEIATFSTLGRINISVSSDLIWHEDLYMITGYLNYRLLPEFILGIGNDVSVDDVEEIEVTRFKFVNYGFIQLKKDFYVGIGADITLYKPIKADSTSFLYTDNVSGINGGTGIGIGPAVAYDTRDNRFFPTTGNLFAINTMFFPGLIGNPYVYSRVDIDMRKYFNPWLNHVIAMQATTFFRGGDVPFYELSQMGGEDKMRGYYKGAIRDKVLIDTQLEYRLPVWNIFGAAGWVGTGRVAPDFNSFSLNDWWLSYGFGLRLKIDSKHNTNMRFDFGFGPHGVNGVYINFAEAF